MNQVDIEPGVLFSWSDSKPALRMTCTSPDVSWYLHDGVFVRMDRPRRWWHLVSWVRVCRKLWRLPTGLEDRG